MGEAKRRREFAQATAAKNLAGLPAFAVVPGHVRDPKLCQALVLSDGARRQCSAKATGKRRPTLPADDPQVYPCCARHRRARWFVLWTPVYGLTGAARLEHTRRALERMEIGGPRPPAAKLVE